MHKTEEIGYSLFRTLTKTHIIRRSFTHVGQPTFNSYGMCYAHAYFIIGFILKACLSASWKRFGFKPTAAMSAARARNKTGSSQQSLPDDPPGENLEQPVQEVPPHGSGPAPPKSRICGWHLLALLPILIAFILYNLPTIVDEYQARTG